MASAGLNCASGSGWLEAEHLDAVAQHVERAALVELVAQAGQQDFAGLCAVVLGERLPRLRLRGLHPCQHIGREERPRPVVVGGVALGIQPAVGGEVLADLGLEVDLFVQAHAASALRVNGRYAPTGAFRVKSSR